MNAHTYRVGPTLGLVAAVLMAGCSGNPPSLGSIAQGPLNGSQSVVRNHVPIVAPAKSLSVAQAPRVTTKSWAAPNSRIGVLVYACTYASSFCEWFQLNRSAVQGQITGLTYPQGLGVDRSGNVWVANTGASNVLVFAKGGTSVIKTLDDPGQFPVDVAIDSDGTAYVANISTTSYTSGSVSVYAPGATSPTRALTDPNFGQVISVAVDENHRVIVCYDGVNAGQCDEFPKAQGSGITKIAGLFFAGGVAFDAAEDVVVSDQTRAFDVYDPPSFAQCATTPELVNEEVMLALSSTNQRLIASDVSQGTVDQFSYGSCSGGVGASTYVYPVGTASDMVIGTGFDPPTTL